MMMMTAKYKVLLVVLALWGLSTLAKPTPRCRTHSYDVVFVVDVSHACSSHLNSIKSILQEVLLQLTSSDRVALVVFGGEEGPSVKSDFKDGVEPITLQATFESLLTEARESRSSSGQAASFLEAISMVVGSSATASFGEGDLEWREQDEGSFARSFVGLTCSEPAGAFHEENRFGDQDGVADDLDDAGWADEVAALAAALAERSFTGVVAYPAAGGSFFGSSLLEHLGDPALGEQYSDGTHFQIGRTLRKLKASESFKSLWQACLSLGVDLRVHNMKSYSQPARPSSFPFSSTAFCNRLDSESSSPESVHDELDDFGHPQEDWPRIPLIVEGEVRAPLPGERGRFRFTASKVVGQVEVVNLPSPSERFIPLALARGTPVIFRGSAISSWRALGWTPSYLSRMGESEYANVKGGTYPYKVFDADMKQVLGGQWAKERGLDFGLPFSVSTMSNAEFWNRMEAPAEGKAWYHFIEPPTPGMLDDMVPTDPLFIHEADAGRGVQGLFVSSRGPNMHTHFDQDHNFFVHIVGKKRFTLVAPSFHESMYMFPRLHPLWHKSQADFDAPDFAAFPNYEDIEAWEANLEPGDVLYVPPYWWHHVESLTHCVSLTSWSRYSTVTHNLNFIYQMKTTFDSEASPSAKQEALEVFLRSLLDTVYGTGHGSGFVARLVQSRYALLGSIWKGERSRYPCDEGEEGSSGISSSARASSKAEGRTAGSHFLSLVTPSEVMDIVLGDYLEEVVASIVSIESVLPFLKTCLASGGRQ